MAYANQGRPGPRVTRSATRGATMKIAMMTVTTTPDAISVWLRSATLDAAVDGVAEADRDDRAELPRPVRPVLRARRRRRSRRYEAASW
ncbi:hypothetical protein ABT120_36800 [Nonomuraea angiospora]|uniref:hypothetical protein n=1 Tax=Nonomuraea angiospora TaxID=46172 RepID=UPI00331A14D8